MGSNKEFRNENLLTFFLDLSSLHLFINVREHTFKTFFKVLPVLARLRTCTNTTSYMWRSEGNFWEVVLCSTMWVQSGLKTQITSLGGQCLYPSRQLSGLTLNFNTRKR